MYRIAVIGDPDSVLGFKALGLEVCPAEDVEQARQAIHRMACLLYTSPSPRDISGSRMPSSA